MMKLSILIPVYNEGNTIATVVNSVLDLDLSALGLEKEIIIINDASTDNTLLSLKPFENHPNIKIVTHKKNKGKGAALHTGIGDVTGDIFIVQDADLECDPRELPKILGPIVEGKADVVFGSRFAGGYAHGVLNYGHYFGNKVLTIFSNILSDLNLTDMNTCYKAIRVDVLRRIRLREKRFGFDPEITAKLAKLSRKGQVRIYEVAISYRSRTYAEGKKIGWKDGFSSIRCIIQYNLFSSF